MKRDSGRCTYRPQIVSCSRSNWMEGYNHTADQLVTSLQLHCTAVWLAKPMTEVQVLYSNLMYAPIMISADGAASHVCMA